MTALSRFAGLRRIAAALGGAGQFAFPTPANPSADPNTLDDYAEGTFSPTVASTGVAATGVTYALQQGRYTKIGRLVLLEGRLAVSSKGSNGTGQVGIVSLPFGASQVVPVRDIRAAGVTLAAGLTLAGYMQGSILFLETQSNTGTAAFDWATLANGADIAFATAFSI